MCSILHQELHWEVKILPCQAPMHHVLTRGCPSDQTSQEQVRIGDVVPETRRPFSPFSPNPSDCCCRPSTLNNGMSRNCYRRTSAAALIVSRPPLQHNLHQRVFMCAQPVRNIFFGSLHSKRRACARNRLEKAPWRHPGNNMR